MKKRRDFLYFPRYFEDVGYQSLAGTYKVEGDSLRLFKDCSLHPLWVENQEVFSYRFEDNNLVLTEALLPTIERVIEGERIIVLKKLQQ